MPMEPELAISNMVDKRLGVCHRIYHGVWNMILSFNVEHDPVAGSRKGVDFTFHVMRYHSTFTVIKEDGQADYVKEFIFIEIDNWGLPHRRFCLHKALQANPLRLLKSLVADAILKPWYPKFVTW